MHTTKRAAFILALAAAFAVGLIAYAVSAGAVATCSFVNSSGNKSCVKLAVAPNNPHGTFKSSQLFVHTRTLYAHPGNKSQGGFAKTVTLRFDNDFRIAPGSIPRCSKAQLSGKNIRQAWNTCGPGAGAAHNAYLSPPGAVSGRTSTAPPSNFNGCTLVFNGPPSGGNPTVTLYARVTLVANGTANCANPAGNTSGNTTVILVGTITNAGVAGFGKKLTVPGIDQLPLPLDDFYATVRRGSYFQARCPAGASPWKLRGLFAYSGSGQPADTVQSTQPCS